MSKKTGITAHKLKWYDKKVKSDFQEIFTALSKAAVMCTAGKYASAFKEFAGIIKGFKFKTNTSDLAYELVLSSLVNAAHDLAYENAQHFNAKFQEEEKLYDDKEYMDFLQGITALIADKELVLEYSMLQNPRSIPILQDFQQYFNQYLQLFGISEIEANLISNRLPTYFVFSLNHEWCNNFSHYHPIYEKLNAPTSEAARRELQMEAYYTYLEREAEQSVFGETFSLKDIFIPLRAYYNRRNKKNKQDEDLKPVAIWLEENLDHWLQESKAKTTIKVIEGGPGSGKSSFVKWWSAKVAKERSIPILFFPLHHFNIHSNIKEAIEEYFKDSPDIPLNFNPFEFDPPKILLVFDGLDELVMQGKSSREAAGAFMEQLEKFCGRYNAVTPRLKVLVTGRPIAIQNTESKLRDSDQQILHLLPYHIKEVYRENYEDKGKILIGDQRNDWWNRFFKFKNLPNNNLPADLRSENMDKITIEPLLNYLVALSWHEAPENFNEDTNINHVYQQLILGVHKRDYSPQGKHKATANLDLDQFIQILEEIAICAWQGGDARLTTERKIEQHIKGRDLKHLLEEYKANAKSGVSRLLTAFYFRKFGKEDTEDKDETFEFTHKSFGEYLTGRAIVELIKLTHEQREAYKASTSSRVKNGWTIEKILSVWLNVTGKNHLDHAIDQFIINELEIRKEKKEPVEAWQQTMIEVINELIVTGIPLHLEARSHHLEERRLARNTEEALFVSLSNCAASTKIISRLRLPTNKKFNYWFNRLSSSIKNRDFAYRKLSYFDFSNLELNSTNLPSSIFNNSKMNSSDLGYANLPYSNFNFTDLSNSSLLFANFSGTSFKDVILTASDLTFANLSLSTLIRTNLTKANLTKANLRSSHLTEVNFTEANLTEVNFTGASLFDIDFTEAYLMRVNLTRTIFEVKDLAKAKSLYDAIGIPNNMKSKLVAINPNIFVPPKKN